ncbi:solute carrier organic anion transporter family member 5A1-like isoform X2 [Tubulanus polymorphus]
MADAERTTTTNVGPIIHVHEDSLYSDCEQKENGGFTNEAFTDDSGSAGASREPGVTATASPVKNPPTKCDKINTRCGCGSCTPDCMQKCAHPMLFLVAVSAVVFVQSFLASGYQNSVNTSVERRFDLWSKEWGLVLSSYDFTAMPASILVSFFAAKRNRSHWIGYGVVTLAVGSITFALPHFIAGPYRVSTEAASGVAARNSSNLVCDASSKRDTSCGEKSPETWALAMLCLGQLILGLGVGPLYTLGPTYIYDSVKRKVYGLYIGIFYSMVAVGPACGFLVGAALLSFYVDPGLKPVGMTESDPRWVGAWWVGYVIVSALLLLTSIPLFLFPKKLPPRHSKRRWKEVFPDEDGDDGAIFANFGDDCKDFPRGIKALFTNPVWLCITLAAVMERSIVSGFVAYVSKYLQVEFHVPSSQANIMTGLVLIPSACFGIIIGGIILKRHPMSNSAIFKFILIFATISMLIVVGAFFVKCDELPFAGITINHNGSGSIEASSINVSSSCNINCKCNTRHYNPVCGYDQITYFSSCHAGCTDINTTGHSFLSCGCVHTTMATAVTGKCPSSCQMLYPFLVILFCMGFVASLCQNPALIITLSCVKKKDRSFSLGMQDSVVRLLAYIPSPIYFGYLFDGQCLLREEICDGSGSCWEYDTKRLPYAIFGTVIALKCVGIVFIALGWMFCQREDRQNAEQKQSAANSDKSEPSAVPTRNGKVFIEPSEDGIYSISNGDVNVQKRYSDPTGRHRAFNTPRLPRSVTETDVSSPDCGFDANDLKITPSWNSIASNSTTITYL